MSLAGSSRPRHLLGRHVCGRAGRGRLSTRPAIAARPKSVMRTWPVAVDHHVGRLQIAVQHAAVVRRGEARRRAGARPRPPSPAAAVRCAAAATTRSSPSTYSIVRNGGRRRRRCRRCGRRCDARSVGRRALRCGTGASRAGLRRRCRAGTSGRPLSELEVIGPIDLAHAAAPERRDDADSGRGKRYPERSGRDLHQRTRATRTGCVRGRPDAGRRGGGVGGGAVGQQARLSRPRQRSWADRLNATGVAQFGQKPRRVGDWLFAGRARGHGRIVMLYFPVGALLGSRPYR